MANSKLESNESGLLKNLTPAEISILKGQVASQLNYTRGGRIPAAVKEVLSKLDESTIEKLKEKMNASIELKKK